MALGHDPDAVAGEQVGRDTLRRAWVFAHPYRWKLAGFVGTILVEAVLQLVPILLFREIIDSAIPDGDRSAATVLAMAAVGVAIVDAGFGLAQRWWSSSIGEGLIFDLRVALFDHVQRMPIAFFTRTQTGSLISRLNNDVVGAQRAVTGTLGQVISNVVVVVTTLITMIVLEWRLSLAALAVLPLFVLPTKRVGRKLQKITREGMELNAEMNATMTERFGVSGAQLVKLFGRHDAERDSFGARAGRVRDIGIKGAIYGRTFFIALGLVGAVGTAVVYWLGAQLVISDALTLGTLVALAAYVSRIYTPLTSLTNARVDLMTALVSFERVFEVLDAPRAIDDREGAYDLVDPRGEVRFDGVSFHYPASEGISIRSLEGEVGFPDQGSDWVLRDLDLTVAPGSMVALVGPSGAGKSTLASLVPRLYDVTEGRVLVDGHDVRDLTQRSLRGAVGVVTQDPHMFHDTIGANLRYARPDATIDELVEACRAAQILRLIESLPDRFDTVVGERGYRLSGGEKQRLSIARLLLKNPAIVILDEATSHLDAENEALVQTALEVALDGRTSIVIAHRLSTVRAADEIIVLDEGRIVERGRHLDLVAAGGLYRDLHTTLESGRSVADAPADAPADADAARALRSPLG
jgi:ATP-binding cassette subfamily B protein